MCKISWPASRRQVLGALLGSAAVFGLAPRGARAGAAAVDLPAPGPRDICQVCGMFVAKYPDWIATILFADGHKFVNAVLDRAARELRPNEH